MKDLRQEGVAVLEEKKGDDGIMLREVECAQRGAGPWVCAGDYIRVILRAGETMMVFHKVETGSDLLLWGEWREAGRGPAF